MKTIEKRKKYGLIGCLSIFLFFAFGIFLIYVTADDTKNEPEDLSTMAYVVSQNYAKIYLKYPQEANFDFFPLSARDVGDNTFEVIGNVETKNGFGMKLNRKYRATLKYNGGPSAANASWQLVNDIEFFE